MLTPEQGAETTIYLASSHDVEGVSGKHFLKERATTSSKAPYDITLTQQLWQVSTGLTNGGIEDVGDSD